MAKRKEELKIRPECQGCRFYVKGTPEMAACRKGNNPTYYRKKKECQDKAFLKKKGIAYTDGSYNPATKKYGTGVCFYSDGEKRTYTDSAYDANGGRQVEGEINGAIKACEMAMEDGCTDLEIRYDYNGIEAWALGFWQTNKDYTIKYARDMQEWMKKLHITFKHVKAHKGNRGNEHADALAKKACGIEVNERKSAENYAPAIPDDVNQSCRQAIEEFYQKKNPSFRDYASLRTYGSDAYSKKDFQELEKYARSHSAADTREMLGDDATGKDYCSCIRWMMRGLSKNDAVRKVQVDIEIRNNCNHGGNK